MQTLKCPECGEPLEEDDGIYYTNEVEDVVTTTAICRTGCETKFQITIKVLEEFLA